MFADVKVSATQQADLIFLPCVVDSLCLFHVQVTLILCVV